MDSQELMKMQRQSFTMQNQNLLSLSLKRLKEKGMKMLNLKRMRKMKKKILNNTFQNSKLIFTPIQSSLSVELTISSKEKQRNLKTTSEPAMETTTSLEDLKPTTTLTASTTTMIPQNQSQLSVSSKKTKKSSEKLMEKLRRTLTTLRSLRSTATTKRWKSLKQCVSISNATADHTTTSPQWTTSTSTVWPDSKTPKQTLERTMRSTPDSNKKPKKRRSPDLKN